MTRLTYFRSAIALPVVLPIIFVGLMLIPGINSAFAALGLLFGGSLVYGGPAYVVFAALALLYLRRRDAAAAQRLALLAPMLVSPFIGATLYVWSGAAGGWDNRAWLREEFVSGLTLGLLFGYAYVALVLLIDVALFRREIASTSDSVQPSEH